ncbi:MAG: YtxH domain-containing protein [Flavobacterium sp.]
MENHNNTGKIIGSFVIGALAGATLGVLFAPRKGTKTRKQIVSEAEKIVHDMQKKVNSEVEYLKESGINAATSLKNKIAQL